MIEFEIKRETLFNYIRPFSVYLHKNLIVSKEKSEIQLLAVMNIGDHNKNRWQCDYYSSRNEEPRFVLLSEYHIQDNYFYAGKLTDFEFLHRDGQWTVKQKVKE